MASFTPPSVPSLSEIGSQRQPVPLGRTAVYMRNRSAANSAASSPPVPARISTMASRSSCGSRGSEQLVQLAASGSISAGRRARSARAARRARDPPRRRAPGLAPARSRAVLSRSASRTIGRQPGVLAAERLQLRRVPRDGRVGQSLVDLLRPRERLAESGLHGLRLGGGGRLASGTSGGTDPLGRRYPPDAACR